MKINQNLGQMRGVVLLASVILVGGFHTTADASTPQDPASNQSVQSKSLLERLSDYASVRYFGTYYGSSINRLGSAYQPNVDGSPDQKSPQFVRSNLTAAYKVAKNAELGVITRFNYFPGVSSSAGARFEMLDPILFLGRNKLLDSNGFALDGQLRLQLPMTTMRGQLRKNNLATSVFGIFNAHYDPPATKFTFGLYGYLKGNVASSRLDASASNYEIYGAPYVNYQLTSTFALTLWVDLLDMSHPAGSGIFSGLSNGTVDIEPGFSWDITKNITINPILNIYPGNLSLASTSFRANIIAKAF